MLDNVKGYWRSFHASFHDSEVILWARLQFLFLAIYESLQMVDISAFISDHRMLQIYIVMNGIVGEYTRRRREKWKEDSQ